MSSISGSSLHNSSSGSGDLTFTFVAGISSQVLRSDRIFKWSSDNCLPHFNVIIQMRYPGYLTMPDDVVDSVSDSNKT